MMIMIITITRHMRVIVILIHPLDPHNNKERRRQHQQEAKERAKLEKDKARYDKLLDMFEKKIKSVDAGLDSMSKYLNELKVLQIVGE